MAPPKTTSDRDLLMRIDERVSNLCDSVDAMNNRMDAMNTRMDNDFVSQAEFWPVKAIVYTGAGLMLTAVVGALIALVVKGGYP